MNRFGGNWFFNVLSVSLIKVNIPVHNALQYLTCVSIFVHISTSINDIAVFVRYHVSMLPPTGNFYNNEVD